MNLQKISLPENPWLFKQDLHHPGMSSQTFLSSSDFSTIHLHHLRISLQSTSIFFGFLLGRLCHISPGPYRGTDINSAWHKSQQCARAIHLAVDTLPQILVGIGPRAGTLILAAPGSRGIATHICIGILTVR